MCLSLYQAGSDDRSSLERLSDFIVPCKGDEQILKSELTNNINGNDGGQIRSRNHIHITINDSEEPLLDDEPSLAIYDGNRTMAEVRRSLIEIKKEKDEDDEEEEEESGDVDDLQETVAEFCKRQARNVLHFLVEDWCLSGLLGIVTAVLSVGMDVVIEQLQHLHVYLYEKAMRINEFLALFQWLIHVVLLTFLAAASCYILSKQAVGSGIPEVKVIMHGMKMKNYLTLRTLAAKMTGLTLAMGSGLPIGKEGPFVHMGAIVATLLSKLTQTCQYSAFFSNEGRETELLSSGCAVGIACTFSAPIGAVLYAIESTSKYFAVKNYWRGFLAATCSAIVFRFANFFVTAEQRGTITAFYQTSFPTESFLIEELLAFAFLGLISGLVAAMFIFTHRRITLFRQKNKIFKLIFRKNFFAFTVFMAAVVGILTYPKGFGKYIAGKLTFRETMADFFNNCTLLIQNTTSEHSCPPNLLAHWTGGNDESGGVCIFLSLTCYMVTYFFLVAICISISVPAGVFVPSFIIGACGGRLMGETMAYIFPGGLRGVGGPPIYPGLYAVVGAAAYTGAVTHTLSVAVIICELTGQLAPILPVLIAMLVGNAICKFLQPSIYESIIRIKKYPYLTDLPPSRISVHTVKVEQIMVQNVVYITKTSTYKELREILQAAPRLKSFPVVTDHSLSFALEYKILLGSVARKYLILLLKRYAAEEFGGRLTRKRATDLFSSIKRSSMRLSRRSSRRSVIEGSSRQNAGREEIIDERSVGGTISGNTLLAISPLHAPNAVPLASLFTKPSAAELKNEVGHKLDKEELLNRVIDLDEVAIDAAPFQLVVGSSLYKVHSLFSLLGLSHAYVTDCGRLIGVIALKELRDALANIYVRGAVPAKIDRRLTSSGDYLPRNSEETWLKNEETIRTISSRYEDTIRSTETNNDDTVRSSSNSHVAVTVPCNPNA